MILAAASCYAVNGVLLPVLVQYSTDSEFTEYNSTDTGSERTIPG